ncbi:MAG: hypothetical protein HY513_05030 [Candidatus Aenigmarchaeota archaeon]|nr:hypothetical protein [Candidatus Aenigmarchaeota archaeon]
MGEKYKNKLMCEIMAQDVLPSLRAFIAKELILENKMNQIAVADWLGVSQPAISQYVRQLRGFNEALMKHESVHKEIKNLCGKMTGKAITKEAMFSELDSICKMAAAILIETEQQKPGEVQEEIKP